MPESEANRNDNWQNVDIRRGKGIGHNGAQRGKNQDKDNNMGIETCSDKPTPVKWISEQRLTILSIYYRKGLKMR